MDKKPKDNKNSVNEEELLEEFSAEIPVNDESNDEKPKHKHHNNEETKEA